MKLKNINKFFRLFGVVLVVEFDLTKKDSTEIYFMRLKKYHKKFCFQVNLDLSNIGRSETGHDISTPDKNSSKQEPFVFDVSSGKWFK